MQSMFNIFLAPKHSIITIKRCTYQIPVKYLAVITTDEDALREGTMKKQVGKERHSVVGIVYEFPVLTRLSNLCNQRRRLELPKDYLSHCN